MEGSPTDYKVCYWDSSCKKASTCGVLKEMVACGMNKCNWDVTNSKCEEYKAPETKACSTGDATTC